MSELLLKAKGLEAPHGFATRAGGVSPAQWESLNLGFTTGDDVGRVERNRDIFLGWFGADRTGAALMHQVHGDRVVEGKSQAPEGELPQADAQVSGEPELLLVVSTADCLPILFHDPRTGAVGAAHCGWRGTVAGLAARVVEELGARYGAKAKDVTVAIGPGICGSCYQVGEEVADAVRDAGAANGALVPDGPGHWRLDLAQVNRRFLQGAGVEPERIIFTGWCTSCDPVRFYSHRRDQGKTGRHWSAIRATAAAE